jgi:hypothetical protein
VIPRARDWCRATKWRSRADLGEATIARARRAEIGTAERLGSAHAALAAARM